MASPCKSCREISSLPESTRYSKFVESFKCATCSGFVSSEFEFCRFCHTVNSQGQSPSKQCCTKFEAFETCDSKDLISLHNYLSNGKTVEDRNTFYTKEWTIVLNLLWDFILYYITVILTSDLAVAYELRKSIRDNYQLLFALTGIGLVILLGIRIANYILKIILLNITSLFRRFGGMDQDHVKEYFNSSYILYFFIELLSVFSACTLNIGFFYYIEEVLGKFVYRQDKIGKYGMVSAYVFYVIFGGLYRLVWRGLCIRKRKNKVKAN